MFTAESDGEILLKIGQHGEVMDKNKVSYFLTHGVYILPSKYSTNILEALGQRRHPPRQTI